jgi:light-regulated signal transduction histidine kinase (bacteriophytochrome)
MKKLIQDLLDYSRIGHQGKLAVINCNELVEELRADLSELIAEMNAVIVYQTLPTIKGYTTEIKLLFLNLVVNAIKFSRPGIRPEVIISGWAENAGWHFKVSDKVLESGPNFLKRFS